MTDRAYRDVRYSGLRECLFYNLRQSSVCLDYCYSHPKAVDSRDSEEVAAPQLHEGDLCEVLLPSSREHRKLEKSLLRKLDARMSILVLIYVLNYVSNSCTLISYQVHVACDA